MQKKRERVALQALVIWQHFVGRWFRNMCVWIVRNQWNPPEHAQSMQSTLPVRFYFVSVWHWGQCILKYTRLTTGSYLECIACIMLYTWDVYYTCTSCTGPSVLATYGVTSLDRHIGQPPSQPVALFNTLMWGKCHDKPEHPILTWLKHTEGRIFLARSCFNLIIEKEKWSTHIPYSS